MGGVPRLLSQNLHVSASREKSILKNLQIRYIHPIHYVEINDGHFVNNQTLLATREISRTESQRAFLPAWENKDGKVTETDHIK